MRISLIFWYSIYLVRVKLKSALPKLYCGMRCVGVQVERNGDFCANKRVSYFTYISDAVKRLSICYPGSVLRFL